MYSTAAVGFAFISLGFGCPVCRFSCRMLIRRVGSTPLTVRLSLSFVGDVVRYHVRLGLGGMGSLGFFLNDHRSPPVKSSIYQDRNEAESLARSLIRLCLAIAVSENGFIVTPFSLRGRFRDRKSFHDVKIALQ